MNPSAKAAQQIAQETFGIMHEMCFTEYQLAKILEQALSDSLRPYRELIEQAHEIISGTENDGNYSDGWLRRYEALKEAGK